MWSAVSEVFVGMSAVKGESCLHRKPSWCLSHQQAVSKHVKIREKWLLQLISRKLRVLAPQQTYSRGEERVERWRDICVWSAKRHSHENNRCRCLWLHRGKLSKTKEDESVSERLHICTHCTTMVWFVVLPPVVFLLASNSSWRPVRLKLLKFWNI